MNAIVPATQSGNALIPTNMESAMRLAEMMARGKLVPNHLQSQPGDCLMVIEQAMRWGMSPFAVAQCTSVIQGKLMFEGKLVSAALNSSGVLEGRLSYEFSGEGDKLAIKVLGTIRGERAPRDVEATLKEAKTSNGMWTKQPDQQLVYFGTRKWARRHAPEVMLGVYSPEEFDATPRPADTFAGTTIEAEAAPQGQPRDPARAINDSLPAHSSGDAPRQEQPKRKTWREVLDDLQADLDQALSKDAVDAIVFSPEVERMQVAATNGTKERLDSMVSAAIRRTTQAAAEDDGFPGVVTRDAAE